MKIKINRKTEIDIEDIDKISGVVGASACRLVDAPEGITNWEFWVTMKDGTKHKSLSYKTQEDAWAARDDIERKIYGKEEKENC